MIHPIAIVNVAKTKFETTLLIGSTIFSDLFYTKLLSFEQLASFFKFGVSAKTPNVLD